MLTPAISSTVKDFVRQEPRTIDDISRHIEKSWLTADRYTQKIAEQDGSLRIKTFRAGTRGALKLVYWNNTSEPAQSSVQEKLFHLIMRGKKKRDGDVRSDRYKTVESKQKQSIWSSGPL